MSLWTRLRNLVTDAPPAFVFEISAAGLAWARPPGMVSFVPLPAGAVRPNPLEANVVNPEALAEAVRAVPVDPPLAYKPCALILPDFCGRVTVLDFDSLPDNPEERLALVRFRIKKNLAFDIETAVVSFTPQPREGSKKLDVAVAVVAREILDQYEAPFKAAGYHAGFVTLSSLAALALPAPEASASPAVVLKQSGGVLSLSVLHHGALRFFRCIELPGRDPQEIADVLFPTFALIEDELGEPARAVRVCGLAAEGLELPLAAAPARSRFGAFNESNAGLHGYLESQGGLAA